MDQKRVSGFWERKRVFVTGGTGLLGSHLTRRLVALRPEVVVCLVRDEVPQSLFYSQEPGWNLNTEVITVKGSVEDYALMERVINEYEINSVFHLAAQALVGIANQSPLSTFKTNIEGTWNLMEACRVHRKRIQSVIIASSDKAYGNLHAEKYDEQTPLRGEHPYDVSKSCADLIAQSYFHSYEVPVSVTRCGNFFGPGDLNFNRLIPGVVRDVIYDRRPVIRSDGQYIRDYIFAEDGALAYLTLAEKMGENPQLNGEAFNFSYGLSLRVLEVVDIILRLMGRTDLKADIRSEATNEIPIQCLSSDKARKVLDWTPHFGFEKGMKETIEWYRGFFSAKVPR